MRLSFFCVRRANIASLILIGTLAAGTAPASASGSDYLGNWNAVNPQRNVVKVEITNSTDGSGATYIHAYGECSPTPCDWGTVPLAGLNSVASRPGSTEPEPNLVGKATFTTSFKTTTMTVSGFHRIGLNDYISVETSSVFTDKSGRAPYTTTESFEKLHPMMPPRSRPHDLSSPKTSGL